MTTPYTIDESDMFKRQWSTFTWQSDGMSTVHQKSDVALVGRTLQGVKDPNWRRKIRLSQNATTPLSATTTGLAISNGSVWKEKKLIILTPPPAKPEGVYTDVARGQLLDPLSKPTLSSAYDSDLFNEALNQFFKKARDKQNELQGLIASGEFGQTVRMIANRARRLRSGLASYLVSAKTRALKRRKGRRNRVTTKDLLKQRSQVIADTWLEYSFGWSPLIADIDNGAKALAKYNTGVAVKSAYCFGLKGKETSSVAASVQQGVGPVACDLHSTTFRVYSCKVYGEVRVDSSTPTLDSTLGLQWPRFIPSVWELLPWSFLVDYFVDIGGWLNAASFPWSEIEWLAFTRRNTATKTRSGSVNAKQTKTDTGVNYVGCGGSPGTAIWTVKVVDRNALYPETVFTYPVRRIPGTTTQFLNLAALARGSETVRRLVSRVG